MVCDSSLRNRGGGGKREVFGELGDEGDAHAAFGCVGFVETGWGCCSLGPPGPIPYEGVASAKVVEGVVVVALEMAECG